MVASVFGWPCWVSKVKASTPRKNPVVCAFRWNCTLARLLGKTMLMARVLARCWKIVQKSRIQHFCERSELRSQCYQIVGIKLKNSSERFWVIFQHCVAIRQSAAVGPFKSESPWVKCSKRLAIWEGLFWIFEALWFTILHALKQL